MEFRKSTVEDMVEDKRTILITGATGFIGTNLVLKLLEENYKVVVLKRAASDLSRLLLFDNKRNIVFYDFEHDQLDDVFEKIKIDMVIHLATYYKKNHIKDDIKNMIQTNIAFPTEILQIMVEHNVKYFINTGTFFEYSLDSNVPVTEKHETNPYDLYAATKIAFEDILKFYTDKFSISTSTLRLFAPYGPFEHENKVIPFMIKNILEQTPIKFKSSGFQKWDYIFVHDIVEAFIKTIDFVINNDVKHEIFNIGSGKAFSIRDIFEQINRIGKTSIEATWDNDKNKAEINYACADITKAKKLLGWEPRFDLQTGLEMTYNWFKQNMSSR